MTIQMDKISCADRARFVPKRLNRCRYADVMVTLVNTHGKEVAEIDPNEKKCIYKKLKSNVSKKICLCKQKVN